MDVWGDRDPTLVCLVDRREQGRAGDLRSYWREQPGVRIQEVGGALRKVKVGVWSEMLGQMEDNRQLVVTLGSGDGMYHPGHTLVPVVSLS